LADLDLQAVRGQLTWSSPLSAAPVAASWGGYAVPTREGGVLFGATHLRDATSTDVDPEEETRNLRTLSERRPALAQAAAAAGPLQSRAALRAATPDRAPLAGALAPGLFVLSGLGGRGFTTAPLLAEHVAALALRAPSPLAEDLAQAVDPGRFQARAARRNVLTTRSSRARP
jgi:tRNA 5-methylaminomethyl-2-thiouridine biosynthesis bifunctional protein